MKYKATLGLIVINIIIFVITLGGNLFVENLGNFWGYTFSNGEWWRLVTSMFVHGGLSHIACNTMTLLQLGPPVETTYGSFKFVLLYILCGLGGGIGSAGINMLLNRSIISVGASGAICGLLGLIAADIKGKKKGLIINVIVALIPILYIGIGVGNVDNLAHFAGFLSGYILGRLFSPKW